MMREEKILKDKFGKVNPFTVPDGYFDSFAERLMENLPEQESHVIHMHAQAWWKKMPLRKMAAALGGVVVLSCGALAFSLAQQGGHESYAVSAHHSEISGASTEGTFEQMADYTMMDNETIYASLVAEN